SRRIAEGVELLGMLTGEAGEEPLARLAELIKASVGNEADSHDVLMRAVAGANLNFPPEFYPELFVLVANKSENGIVPPVLLEKLPEAQRAFVVSSAVAALSELEPEALGTQVM